MAVSVNVGVLQNGFRAPLKGSLPRPMGTIGTIRGY